MVDTVAIALFRHGMTEANHRKAYLGWTDSPLCTNDLPPVNPCRYEKLFSSDLGRCLKTAQHLFPGQLAVSIPELRELNFGDWEGKTYEELKGDVEYQRWVADPLSNRTKKGESFAEFSARVNLGFTKITTYCLEAGIRRAGIITHGGVIRYLMARYASDQKAFWEWSIPYGKGYELTWTSEGLRREQVCISFQEVPLTESQNG